MFVCGLVHVDVLVWLRVLPDSKSVCPPLDLPNRMACRTPTSACTRHAPTTMVGVRTLTALHRPEATSRRRGAHSLGACARGDDACDDATLCATRAMRVRRDECSSMTARPIPTKVAMSTDECTTHQQLRRGLVTIGAVQRCSARVRRVWCMQRLRR